MLRVNRGLTWNIMLIWSNTQLMLTHNRLNTLRVQLQTRMTLTVPYKKFTLSQREKRVTNWFHSLPSQRFQALLTLFPKSFSPFLHSTCLLSVSSQYLALEENYLPFSAPVPKYATLNGTPNVLSSKRKTGFSPSLTLTSKKTYVWLKTGGTYQDYNSPTSR